MQRETWDMTAARPVWRARGVVDRGGHYGLDPRGYNCYQPVRGHRSLPIPFLEA